MFRFLYKRRTARLFGPFLSAADLAKLTNLDDISEVEAFKRLSPLRWWTVMVGQTASADAAAKVRRMALDILASSKERTEEGRLKNIQIIDGALNATFSIFQATDEEFAAIFPAEGQDIEISEDFHDRVGLDKAVAILGPIWERPILKRDAQGIHGTLYYNHADRRRFLPATKREVDWDVGAINPAQRKLFASKR